MRVHVLNHHFWPDGSPSGVLEEQLADTLRQMGYDTVLVAGSGAFHSVERDRPESPLIHLPSREASSRTSKLDILRDYLRFWRAARAYIRTRVHSGDAVLATSSPFLNVFLVNGLRRQAPGSPLIFHLHDYLPSNVSSLGFAFRMAAPVVRWVTDHYLRKWDMVISCAGNIAYHGANAAVARFWPTVPNPEHRRVDVANKRALYAGNLGIAHNVDALVAEMDRHHADGWEIDCYGDGPAIALLPEYVHRHPFASGEEYLDVLCSHRVHFIVGVSRADTGAFPSKSLNSLYVGATVVACGFGPQTRKELDYLRAVPDLTQNRQYAAELVDAALKRLCAASSDPSSR